MSVRDFPPVELPPGALDGRFSVTFGKAENVCPRSAFLYVKYNGGAATHPLERGSALHRVIELATRATVEQDERRVPPEVAKAIVGEVLADPAYRCPLGEHDYLREAAFRWAAHFECDPRAVVAVESLMVLEVGGWQVRAKVDFAELRERGAVLRLEDYKSSRAMPTLDDIGRRRPDGSIAAKDYQLVLYALCCVFGRPVRVEAGPAGERVEVVDPFPVAGRAQRVDLAYVFPGIEDKVSGGPARREMSLTVLELREYLESVRAQVAHVEYRKRSGDWPAVLGSHCAECPAPSECPIPQELRGYGGIQTHEQAVELAACLEREKADHAATRKELMSYVKTLPMQRLRFGRDMVIEPVNRRSEEIPDKEGMFAALERARLYGEPFNRADWVRERVTTAPAVRRLSEAELAAELASEGSNEEAA